MSPRSDRGLRSNGPWARPRLTPPRGASASRPRRLVRCEGPVILSLALLAAPGGTGAVPATTGATVAESIGVEGANVPLGSGLGPREVELLTGGARPESPLPLVVLLHGLGDTGAGIAPLLRGFGTPARVLAPTAPLRHRSGNAWFRVRARSGDPSALAAALAAAADRLAQRIAALAEARGAERVLVTGFSQGGMLSFALAVRHPSLVAGAIPIGGLLPRPLRPSTAPANAPPVVALHGALDRIVPYERARETVRALTEAGFEARLETDPEAGHTVSDPMVEDLYRALRALLPRAAGARAGQRAGPPARR